MFWSGQVFDVKEKGITCGGWIGEAEAWSLNLITLLTPIALVLFVSMLVAGQSLAEHVGKWSELKVAKPLKSDEGESFVLLEETKGEELHPHTLFDKVFGIGKGLRQTEMHLSENVALFSSVARFSCCLF